MESSASTASSSLSRWRPAVLAVAGLAAAGSVYLLVTVGLQHHQPWGGTSLHRSNAIRRRPIRSNRTDPEGGGGEVADGGDDDLHELLDAAEHILDDSVSALRAEIPQPAQHTTPGLSVEEVEAETEQSLDEEDLTASSTGQDSQRLQELVYAIAKSNAEKEGVIHRGVTCDKCSRVPIVGVRYHCANCPDFDLCEDCEATDCHLKTHVFYKVKVPAPWGGKQPLPVWYPGKPTEMPPELESGWFKNQLCKETGFSHSKVDGLYHQFTCMANVKHAEDRHGPGMAIDRAAFDQCFIAQAMTGRPAMPNLVHDRLFAFYDNNKDGVIDFSEFVVGMSLVHGHDNVTRNTRVFKGLDLDDNGYISRKDCLKMFKAYYALNKDIMLGYLGVEREGENAEHIQVGHDPRSHVASGRPLASYFNDGVPQFTRSNIDEERKRLDDNNDLVPEAHVSTVWESNAVPDYMSRWAAVNFSWADARAIFIDEVTRLCGNRAMRYLNHDQVRAIHRDSLSDPTPRLIERDGALWAAGGTYYDVVSYVRIKKVDIPEGYRQLLDDYQSLMDDGPLCDALHNAAVDRLCRGPLEQAIYHHGRSLLNFRQEYRQFLLEDEEKPNGVFSKTEPSSPTSANSSRPSPEPSPEVWFTEGLSLSSNIRPQRSRSPASEPGSQTPDPITRMLRQPSRTELVGGTAALQTIYHVVEVALNELLDPLFKARETLALEVQKTQTLREQHKEDIAKLLKLRQNIVSISDLVHMPVDEAHYVENPQKRAEMRKDLAARVLNLMETNDDLFRDVDMIVWAINVWRCNNGMDGTVVDVSDPPRAATLWIMEFEAACRLEFQAQKSPTVLEDPPWRRSAPPESPLALQPKDNVEPIGKEAEDREPEEKLEAAKEPVIDTTMPQHRPDVSDLDWRSSPLIRRLACLEAAAMISEERGGPGRVEFSEFQCKMEVREKDGEGGRLLQWLSSWVDVVMF